VFSLYVFQRLIMFSTVLWSQNSGTFSPVI